ncbi:MAG: hypothetical protein M0R48_11810 [Candidatus Omnitrophica bacterium]|nr:hypothetical protein [Candidatus Omnitrophota bacterium]
MKKSELLEEIDSLHETGNCHLIKTENDIAIVNGVILSAPDFGTLIHDKSIDSGYPIFNPIPPEEYVLEKYGITEEEYQDISEILQKYFEMDYRIILRWLRENGYVRM